MPDRELPVRPNLEQYKKQAKELARDCRAGDPAALERMRNNHPRFAEIHGPHIALTETQLVIAREHGFESWPKFAAHITKLNLDRALDEIDDPVSSFLIAASVPRGTAHVSGTLAEAEAILARYPHLAHADIYTSAVLGDDQRIRNYLASDPALSTATGGPYHWNPLTYLCFSRFLRLDNARSEGFTRAARLLLDAGADPNGGWHEKPDYPGGQPVWESMIYGAAGLARHPGVTRLLLEKGADPNDGETPYHAPESYDNTITEILFESGKLDERSKVWILVRKADWHDYDGMKLALDYGANPNWIPQWGNTALQHSIQRDNRIEMISLLLERGADPLLTNMHTGRSSAALAASHGRDDVLRLLAERGIDPQLDGVHKLIAACALADEAMIHAILTEEPGLRTALLTQGGTLLGDFAGVGNAAGVGCLLDLGVPVDAPYPGDGYFDRANNSTALHIAAWHSRPEVTRLLVNRGANVNASDGKARTPLQLAVKACVDSYWTNRRTPEGVEALLNAGATLDGIEIPCGYVEVDELLNAAAGRKQ